MSINNIAGQDLELKRQDTWKEAANQIQARSSFHPEHQIIQIIRFQVSYTFLTVFFNRMCHKVFKEQIPPRNPNTKYRPRSLFSRLK